MYYSRVPRRSEATWAIIGKLRRLALESLHYEGKHAPQLGTRAGSLGPPHIVLCVSYHMHAGRSNCGCSSM